MARECGACTVCCEHFPLKNIHPCPALGVGCAVQHSKPATCVAFRCGWLRGNGQPSDRPDKSGILEIPAGPGMRYAATYKVENGALEELT